MSKLYAYCRNQGHFAECRFVKCQWGESHGGDGSFATKVAQVLLGGFKAVSGFV